MLFGVPLLLASELGWSPLRIGAALLLVIAAAAPSPVLVVAG